MTPLYDRILTIVHAFSDKERKSSVRAIAEDVRQLEHSRRIADAIVANNKTTAELLRERDEAVASLEHAYCEGGALFEAVTKADAVAHERDEARDQRDRAEQQLRDTRKELEFMRNRLKSMGVEP